MTSYLIDFVLLAALVFTSWRAGRMYRELRELRTNERGLAEALEAADRSINKAAHAVVVLKSEGFQTLQALEARIDEARATVERLDALISRADWHAAGRHRAPGIAPAPPMAPDTSDLAGFAPARTARSK